MTYFIALICLLLPSYLIRFSVFGIPTTLLEVLIYIAAIITLILKFKSQNLKPQLKSQNLINNSQYLIPIILFVVAGIISVFITPDKKDALGLFKAYIFDPVLFMFVLIYNIKNKKQIDLLLKALILSGVAVAIHAIYQHFTGQLAPDGRVVGIFGYSPNYLALYLTPISVLTFGYSLLVSEAKEDAETYITRKIWLYDLAFIAMVWAILLSGSRAAIAAVIIGAISYFVIKYWTLIKSRKIFVLLFSCFLVVLIIAGWFMTKPDWQLSREQGGRVTSSNNIRWEIWKTTVKDIIPIDRNWLLGVGLGNYQNYFTDLTKDRVNFPEWISPMALTPHNLFLTIWVNLGLLGLIAFVWILYLFFKSSKNSKPMAYSLILMAVMIAILIQGLVDSPYWKNDLAVMIWIIIGLIFINKSSHVLDK